MEFTFFFMVVQLIVFGCSLQPPQELKTYEALGQLKSSEKVCIRTSNRNFSNGFECEKSRAGW